MEYAAKLSKEGTRTLIDFPDCPGCQTFFDPDEDSSIEEVAAEALDGWLAAHLMKGDAPPQPTMDATGPSMRAICVSPALAIALQIRWRRQELGLSQAQLGKLLGVSRQQASALEDPDANWRLDSLLRVAKALDVQLDIVLLPPVRRRRLASRSKAERKARKNRGQHSHA